jgi:solute carrier family 8 (sodium/calcium exchanger)
LTFGYRTIEDSAKPPKDYTHCEEVVTMKKRETEIKIHIPIIDDDEWEPDLDFFVELYDPNKVNPETGLFEKLNGDDTSCKVTILDEDFPGCLGFEITDVRVSAKSEKVEIKIVRMEGADGTISCMLRTEHLSELPNPSNAIEFEDFVPKHEEIKFLHGENEKTITIKLVPEKIA